MLTRSIQAIAKISFADYLMAYYRNSYSKFGVQAASVFTITFMVFCLSMLLANAVEPFKSPIFTVGSVLSLPGLYLPIIILLVARVKYKTLR